MSAPVVLTRVRGRNDGLADRLAAHGVPTLEWPGLHIATTPPACGLDRFANALGAADAIGFVSPSAVRATVALLHGAGRGLPPAPPIVVQGPGTARALWQAGRRADVVASPTTAEGMVAALGSLLGGRGTVVLPRGDRARDAILDGLAAIGLDVQTFTVYANRAPSVLAYDARPLRAVVYASPSAAERLLRANPWLLDVPAIAMGPTTATWLRDAGHHRVIEPTSSHEEALCEAVLAHTTEEIP